MIYESVPQIIKKFPRGSPTLNTLIRLGPGLVAMNVKYLTIEGETLHHTAETPEELNVVQNGLSVHLSRDLLSQLEQPRDMYMFDHAPFPVFAHMSMTERVDSLMGLTKIIDTKDPVSMDELQFPTIDKWKGFYEALKPMCVAVCSNGHGMSFDTVCNFMRDDGWDPEECHELVKIKCPACRKRFLIHNMLPMLCAVFMPFSEAESEKAAESRKKKDTIRTYFSTLDDEDEDEELEDLRRLVQREEAEEAEDEAEDEEDGDYVPGGDSSSEDVSLVDEN
jgi:hypothetical protein